MISLLKILKENQTEIEVKNPNYYQQLVDQTNFSPKEKKYYTSLINAIKNKGNRATPNQYHTLQQIKKGKLMELGTGNHYLQRKRERGKILNVTNIPKNNIKEYDFEEVRQRLISNIETELQSRLNSFENKNVNSSFTFCIGYKLLKPILVVDSNKYELSIHTEYLKSTKKGETILKSNIGTYYAAVLIDNKIVTLLLSANDAELETQIQEHLKRIESNLPVKILTLEDFIYEIDIDDLFGNKKQIQKKLIDPASLPYELRTDYRIGAIFNHKDYGKGIIKATSAGNSGRGDSRGFLDWVDVEYPKPFVKGGKLTNIRRIEGIYTLVSPLILK